MNHVFGPPCGAGEQPSQPPQGPGQSAPFPASDPEPSRPSGEPAADRAARPAAESACRPSSPSWSDLELLREELQALPCAACRPEEAFPAGAENPRRPGRAAWFLRGLGTGALLSPFLVRAARLLAQSCSRAAAGSGLPEDMPFSILFCAAAGLLAFCLSNGRGILLGKLAERILTLDDEEPE